MDCSARPTGRWIALFGTNKLGHLDPKTAKLTESILPNAGARPRRLAITSDGRIWYSDYARGYLGMYDPKTKAATEWKTPDDNSATVRHRHRTDGAVWFNEARQGTMVHVRSDDRAHGSRRQSRPGLGRPQRDASTRRATGCGSPRAA